MVVPLFDTSDESSEEDDVPIRSRHSRRAEEAKNNEPTVQVREMMLNYVLDRIRDRRNRLMGRPDEPIECDDGEDNSGEDATVEVDEGREEAEAVTNRVTAVIEYNPSGSQVILCKNAITHSINRVLKKLFEDNILKSWF